VKRVAAAVAGLVTALVVAGCGAGQNTQTDSVLPAVNGAIGQAGPIAIRDAQFAVPTKGVFPAGSDAPLRLTIVNTSAENADELIEVTSPVADEVEITGDRSLQPQRPLLVDGGGGTVGSSPASSSSARPTGSSSAPAPPAPVEIGKARIVLKGLSSALFAGKTYPVTFVFRNAGSVTVQLPIANPPSARPEPTSESHG
jgi:copper(I)-binding protein